MTDSHERRTPGNVLTLGSASRCSARVVLVGFLVSPAIAQQTIDELFGGNAGDRFGAAVAFVGDLDHDGKEDFAAGAPGDDTAGADAGRVVVFSGADRTVLFERYGLFPGSRLGEAIDGIGDVDGDGTDDLIAGAPGVSQALVLSGADGTTLFDLAPGSGAEFGTSVAGLGLVDGDATPDFAVGATAGTGLWVFSGQTGNLHWSDSTVALDLGGLGDVDGDGQGDLVAGDHTYNGFGGRAVVFSGLTGAVIRQHTGDNVFQDQLGKGASGVGDIDGDTIGDYGYGVPCICFSSHYSEIRSGATGALIHTLTEFTTGWDLAPGGDLDLDLDGTPDVLVTEPGQVFAYSGADGAELFAFGSASVVDGGADAAGDERVDILAGAKSDSTSGAQAGRVSLYTLGCTHPRPTSYCTALPNSTGATGSIDSEGSTSMAANDLVLTASDLPIGYSCLFVYSPDAVSLPLGNGILCVGSSTLGFVLRLDPLVTSPAGQVNYPYDNTAPPSPLGQVTAGETWYFQLWFRDAGGAFFNFTDGLSVTFCPCPDAGHPIGQRCADRPARHGSADPEPG